LLVGSTGFYRPKYPLIRRVEILLALRRTVTVKIRSSAIRQIQILHGVVIGGADFDGTFELGDRVLDE
jgi:hypothetical protein